MSLLCDITLVTSLCDIAVSGRVLLRSQKAPWVPSPAEDMDFKSIQRNLGGELGKVKKDVPRNCIFLHNITRRQGPVNPTGRERNWTWVSQILDWHSTYCTALSLKDMPLDHKLTHKSFDFTCHIKESVCRKDFMDSFFSPPAFSSSSVTNCSGVSIIICYKIETLDLILPAFLLMQADEGVILPYLFPGGSPPILHCFCPSRLQDP